MALSVAFEVLVAASLLGVLVAFVVRAGVHRNLLIAVADRGFGPVTVFGVLAVSIAGVALTGLAGTPDFDRYGLTAYELGVALFLAGTVLLGTATARGREYRQLSTVNATTVRAAEDGDVVALTGTARGAAEELPSSPVTRTPCLAYDARLETGVRTLRIPSTFYVVDERRRAQVPFSLEGETGSIVVDPSDARVELPAVEATDGAEPRLRLARALGGADASAERSARRRSERRLDPETEVGVLGTVTRSGDRRIVDADAVFVTPWYDRTVRRTVRRNGAIGAGAFCAGLAVMVLAAGFP